MYSVTAPQALVRHSFQEGVCVGYTYWWNVLSYEVQYIQRSRGTHSVLKELEAQKHLGRAAWRHRNNVFQKWLVEGQSKNCLKQQYLYIFYKNNGKRFVYRKALNCCRLFTSSVILYKKPVNGFTCASAKFQQFTCFMNYQLLFRFSAVLSF